MTESHIVLVPGFWLGAWAWDAVVEELRSHGHQATAVTLPGRHDAEPARGSVTWADQVAGLAAIVEQAGPGVVLVAHSGAGSIASGVLDRNPDAVERMIYVDSGPSADGAAYDPGLEPELAEVPLPSFEKLSANGASLEGLSEDDLAEFRRRAVPEPGLVIHEPIHLGNDRRRDVPSTLIACSISSATVRELAQQAHPMFAEVAELRDLAYVDLPTGHWPMFSRPKDLAEAIIAVAQARGDQASARPEPAQANSG
jgi:pimeloyl-ACP methyl ester carboxylesterase